MNAISGTPNTGHRALSDAATLAQIRSGAGFIAALDQSGGSTGKALEAYGIARSNWSGDEEMFALVHRMRVRIMTSPSFDGRRVLAAILFERTMEGQVNGHFVPAYLRSRGIVPFLKIDKGLEREADGVQLMKSIGGLAELLERARSLGVFGTKMRSVVNRSDPAGIAAIVEQQFKLADQVAATGLMPILEPEILLQAPTRAVAERILMAEIIKRLDSLTGDRQVMLKLTIPEQPDGYAPLVGHHRVARVVALSGGLSRGDAGGRLAQNHGIIASFSRALLEDLDHDMDDATFDRALTEAIEQIHAASIFKCWS